MEHYFPRSVKKAKLDGAYFGTTFPHLLLMMNPEHIPEMARSRAEPTVYGFKIHKDAEYFTLRYAFVFLVYIRSLMFMFIFDRTGQEHDAPP